MSVAPQHVPGVTSRVLLVVSDCAVSQAAISRTAELAGGSPVTVVGVGPEHLSGTAGPEQLRRSVALAMSVLENAGVVALGHIAVTGSPARTLARVARARGARVVILDHAGAPASGGLAVDLRRRVYGSGIVVMTANDRGGRWVVRS
jgi:universal stress protein family protein